MSLYIYMYIYSRMYVQAYALKLETKPNLHFLKWNELIYVVWGSVQVATTSRWGHLGMLLRLVPAPTIPKFELLKRKDLICVGEGSVAVASSFHLGHLENCLRLLRTPKFQNLPISLWKLKFQIFPGLTRPAQSRPSTARGVPLFVLREKLHTVFAIVHFQRICRFIEFRFFENLDFSIFQKSRFSKKKICLILGPKVFLTFQIVLRTFQSQFPPPPRTPPKPPYPKDSNNACFVYKGIRMYIYVMYIYTYSHSSLSRYIYIYIHIWAHAYVCTHTCMWISVYVHSYTYSAYMRIYTSMDIRAYAHRSIHTYI